jgi:Tol biopolymer transport system component
VNVGSSRNQANDLSSGASISADGRIVAFYSYASNLVAGDTNGAPDVFVRDRQAGATQRVSVSSSDKQANNGNGFLSVSSDGRLVAFLSSATNLVARDTNNFSDIFVRDRSTGTTERVSISSSGNEADASSRAPSISADGRFVAFSSDASNLVASDTNRSTDVFVHEFRTDTKAPKVVRVAPARRATDVGTRANVKATFSERVYYVKANFKLYRKGSSRPIAAAVHSVAGTSGKRWVLNPNEPLRAGIAYTAKVKTGVVDKVGHHLDQSATQSGNQPMTWTFRTRG